MKVIAGTALAALLAAGFAGAGAAQGFDPRNNCGEILDQAGETDQNLIAGWAFGFIAANTDNIRPVTPSNNQVILKNIQQVCEANPGASLLDLVSASASKPTAPEASASDPAPGSEAEVQALLQQFYAPGADYRALTQALLPTEAEVKALYADPLGAALWNDLSAQIGPDTAFGPKPEHNDLLVVHTTTRALHEGGPILDEFPGGYKDVVQYFKIDVPIVRFKFVTAGKTLGLAFDGLVYVNGHWVIMPEPWRSLPG